MDRRLRFKVLRTHASVDTCDDSQRVVARLLTSEAKGRFDDLRIHITRVSVTEFFERAESSVGLCLGLIGNISTPRIS
jgi:hypothetical protein